MRKITFRDVLTWFIIVCGFLCAFFGPLCVSVLADSSPTYVEGSGQWVCYDSYNYSGSNYSYWWVNIPVGARYCILKGSDNKFMLVVVSQSSGLSFQRAQSSSSDTPPDSNISTISLSKSNISDGVTYYTPSNFGAPPSLNAVASSSGHNFNIPVNVVSSVGVYNYSLAYQYTYGSSFVAPGPVIDYGDIDASYSTKIAGSGNESINNIDVISWADLDTNGNSLTDLDATVEIKVSSGNYFSTVGEADLLTKIFSDFTLDDVTSDLHSFTSSYSASVGSASFSWSDIVNNLAFESRYYYYRPVLKNGAWMLKGWRYEARFIVDGYSSPWQILYSVTSSGVQNSQNIINSTNYNYDVYNSLQEITDINNDNSTTYTVYDNSVTVNNSNVTNNSDDGNGGKKSSFWDFLITIIKEGFDLIKTAIKGLVDLVTGLFNIDWNFNIDSGIQSVKDRGGIFSQALQVEEDINTALQSVQEDDFILMYDAVIVNNVTLIPSGSINFDTYFSAVGLSHSDLYFYTDGFIYLSLLILVSRKLIAFLRR